MSGHGFHVHGPYDHGIEHATQGHAGLSKNNVMHI
jgi:hypothetical protein